MSALNRYQKDNAINLIDGNYFPAPGKSGTPDAFEKAKNECIANLEKQLSHVRLITAEDFYKSDDKPTFFDFAKDKAGQIVQQLTKAVGKYHPEMDFLAIENVNYEGRWTKEVFTLYLENKRLLVELAERDTPLQGHLVQYHDKHGVAEHGILLHVRSEGQLLRMQCCLSASYCINSDGVYDYGITGSYSGGPTLDINANALLPLDTIEKRYWFSTAARAGHGIYITIPMRRWYYDVTSNLTIEPFHPQ